MSGFKYVVRPRHGSVVEFLLRYAINVQTDRPQSHTCAIEEHGKCVQVCLVKRPYGPEATICVDYLTLVELNALNNEKRWFLLPERHLREFLKGQVIR